MLENRIRFKPLMEKITDPDTACLHIQNGTNVFISGFTAGYPKLIPQALVRRAEAGERLKSIFSPAHPRGMRWTASWPGPIWSIGAVPT
jgi:acyl-CoA hydrolase